MAEKTCSACGDKCLRRKYQPEFCRSCNLFTWRALSKRELFSCNFNNACQVTKEEKRCRACRIRKLAACWVEHYQRMSHQTVEMTKMRKFRQKLKVVQLQNFVMHMDSARKVDTAHDAEQKVPSFTEDRVEEVIQHCAKPNEGDSVMNDVPQGEEVAGAAEKVDAAPGKVIEKTYLLYNIPCNSLYMPFLQNGVPIRFTENIDTVSNLCRMTIPFDLSWLNRTSEFKDASGEVTGTFGESLVDQPIPHSSQASVFGTNPDSLLVTNEDDEPVYNPPDLVGKPDYIEEYYELREIYLRLSRGDNESLARYCEDLELEPLNVNDLFPELAGIEEVTEP